MVVKYRRFTKEMGKFKQFLCSNIGKASLIILFYAIIFSIFALCITSNVDFILYVMMAVCVIFGWKALNKITANFFLIYILEVG